MMCIMQSCSVEVLYPLCSFPDDKPEMSAESEKVIEAFIKAKESATGFITQLKKINAELPAEYLKQKNSEVIDAFALFNRRTKMLTSIAERSVVARLNRQTPELARLVVHHKRCWNLAQSLCSFSPEGCASTNRKLLQAALLRLKTEIPYLSSKKAAETLDERIQALFVEVMDKWDEKLGGVKIDGASIKKFLLPDAERVEKINITELKTRIDRALSIVEQNEFVEYLKYAKIKQHMHVLHKNISNLKMINTPLEFQVHITKILSQIEALIPTLTDVDSGRYLAPALMEDFFVLIDHLDKACDLLSVEESPIGEFILSAQMKKLSLIPVDAIALKMIRARSAVSEAYFIEAIKKKLLAELFYTAKQVIEEAKTSLSPDLQPQIMTMLQIVLLISKIIGSADNPKIPEPAYRAELESLLHLIDVEMSHNFISDKTILEFLVNGVSSSEQECCSLEVSEELIPDVSQRERPEALISALLTDLDLIRTNTSKLEEVKHLITTTQGLDSDEFYLSDEEEA